MREDRDIINFEAMGGWPMYKMNLREIIEAIGGMLKTNRGQDYWEIPESSKLDVYPLRLHADCMGYGTGEQWITDFNLFTDPSDESKVYCNVFTEDEIRYPSVWVDAGVYPGCEIELETGIYSIDDVDETDDGFMFICNEHDVDDWRTIIDKKIISFDEIKNMK